MYNCLQKIKAHFSPKLLALLTVFMLICMSAQAATYYWVGGATGNWSDATKWSTDETNLTPQVAGSNIPGSDASDIVKLISAANITITNDVQIQELWIPNPNQESTSFIVTLTGSGSIETTSKIETVRAAKKNDEGQDIAEDNATSTLIFECNVTSPSMIMHSGGNITIAEGKSANITSIQNLGGASPSTLLTVKGTLTSTSIALSDVTTRKITVEENGKLNTGSITGSSESVTNYGEISISNTAASDLDVINFTGTGTIKLADNTPYYWTGENGNDWNEPDNWNPNTVPASGAYVVINNNENDNYPLITESTILSNVNTILGNSKRPGKIFW